MVDELERWTADDGERTGPLPLITLATEHRIQMREKIHAVWRSAFRPTLGGSPPMQALRMTDPRNVAHDKKVHQEKKHRGEEIAPDAEHVPQPGQKPALKHSEKSDEETETGKDAS